MDNLFSTHPNTDNRIAELEKLAAELGATGRRAPGAVVARPAERLVGRRARAVGLGGPGLAVTAGHP